MADTNETVQLMAVMLRSKTNDCMESERGTPCKLMWAFRAATRVRKMQMSFASLLTATVLRRPVMVLSALFGIPSSYRIGMCKKVAGPTRSRSAKCRF